MSRTRAFATVCEGNFGAIRLNVAGREPNGIVPSDQVDRLLDELAARVADSPDLVGAERGHRLYPGPHGTVVPDLIVETGTSTRVLAKRWRQTSRDYDHPSPDHALQGILIAAGPSIAGMRQRARADVSDIAPTSLHLLANPVYAEMAGRVLSEFLADPDSPVTRIREIDDPNFAAAPDSATHFSAEERRELEDRLRSLGYAD
jgi:predicted AlkP superfamily phosphohydrolase/phosphomutase